MNKKLIINPDEIADFCRRHHIRKLAIFGSALQDDFGPESDVDVLVDFMAGHVPGFFGLIVDRHRRGINRAFWQPQG